MPTIPRLYAEMPDKTPVLIQGLSSQSGQKLNGKIGFISKARATEPGRIAVSVPQMDESSQRTTSKTISIKPENLLDLLNDHSIDNLSNEASRKFARFLAIHTILSGCLSRVDNSTRNASFEKVILAGMRGINVENKDAFLDQIKIEGGRISSAYRNGDGPADAMALGSRADALAVSYITMTWSALLAGLTRPDS